MTFFLIPKIIFEIIKLYNFDCFLAIENNDIGHTVITILEKWQNISIPLWELARNPDRYVGTNINVSGFVGKIYGDYFYLVDSEDEYSIIVFYNPLLFQNFSQGDKVCITARVTYNEENLRYDLQADERIHNILILEGK